MINLLPPTYKAALAKQQKMQLLFILVTLMFLFIVSLSLLLYAIGVYLGGQIQGQDIILEAKKQNLTTNSALKQELQRINADISRVATFYKHEFRGSEVLERLADLLPPEIRLTGVTYRKDGGIIIVSGVTPESNIRGVPERDVFLAFQEMLEKEPLFDRIDSPQANLLRTDFSLTITLKK